MGILEDIGAFLSSSAPQGTLSPDQTSGIANQALLGLGGGLLSAAGPSPVRISTGQAIGQGIKQASDMAGQYQNNVMRNQAIQAQTNATTTDTALKKINAQMMLDKVNSMRGALFGKAPIGMDDFLSSVNKNGGAPAPGGVLAGGVPPSGGPTGPDISGPGPLPAGGSSVPGGVPAAGGPGVGHDPNRMNDVLSGKVPGSPQENAQAAAMWSYWGDKDRSAYHQGLATGKDGFVPDPNDWQAPWKPIPGGPADPNYQGNLKYQSGYGEGLGKYQTTPIELKDNSQLINGAPSAPRLPFPTPYGAPQGPQAMGGRPPMPGQGFPALPQPVAGSQPIARPMGPPPGPGPAPMGQQPGGNPSPQQAPIGPRGNYTNTTGLTNELAKLDANEVQRANETAAGNFKDKATVQAVQDFLPRVQTGWNAGLKQDAAVILQGLGVDPSGMKDFMGTDASAGALLNKKFLELSSAATRAMGAREPGSVMQMFQKTYPNIDTPHDAIVLQTNGIKFDRQRQMEEANQKDQWFRNQVNGFKQGGQYNGLTGFNSAFNQSHDPTYYLRASEAVSAPDISQGLQKQIQGNLKSVKNFDQVFNLIPSGSRFMAPDGSIRVKP